MVTWLSMASSTLKLILTHLSFTWAAIKAAFNICTKGNGSVLGSQEICPRKLNKDLISNGKIKVINQRLLTEC